MPLSNYTDRELAEKAEAGLAGQGATVEMMHHLRETLRESDDGLQRLNRRLLWYTLAILFVAIFQAGIIILSWLVPTQK